MPYKRLLSIFLIIFTVLSLNSCTMEKDKSVNEPSDVAKKYIETWIQKDFTEMWSVCTAKPFFVSENVLKRAMKIFPMPVRKGKIVGIKQDKDNPNKLLVDYSIEGPTLGCILCILKESHPRNYSIYLPLTQLIDRLTNWHGTLSMSKVGGKWKVIDDSNQLIRTIYLVHAKSLLNPSTTWYDILVTESIKSNMEVEEYMDKYHPEMLSCCEELTEEIRKINNLIPKQKNKGNQAYQKGTRKK